MGGTQLWRCRPGRFAGPNPQPPTPQPPFRPVAAGTSTARGRAPVRARAALRVPRARPGVATEEAPAGHHGRHVHGFSVTEHWGCCVCSWCAGPCSWAPPPTRCTHPARDRRFGTKSLRSLRTAGRPQQRGPPSTGPRAAAEAVPRAPLLSRAPHPQLGPQCGRRGHTAGCSGLCSALPARVLTCMHAHMVATHVRTGPHACPPTRVCALPASAPPG